MRYRLLLLLMLVSFFSVKAMAETFVVTSNADAGPGTLRDALTKAAANGSATQDIITFSLPTVSEAGRTIAASTTLPKMTSNLIIDGTTQPGLNFGVTDAKVQITYKFVYPDQLKLLYSDDADYIEIYGLFINCDATGYGGAGIGISNFEKVIIGAPFKGNIINGANVGIHNGKTCIYQNNNSGTDISGEAPAGGTVGISCNDVTIGGSESTANVFFRLDVTFNNLTGNRLILSNNKFGTNLTGTKRVPLMSFSQIVRCIVQGTYVGPQPVVDAAITNNIFVDEYFGFLLNVVNIAGQVKIQGNSFNSDRTGVNLLANSTTSGSIAALVISGEAAFLVGGDDPDQKNIISYATSGISYEPNGNYIFKRNSIFCTGEATFAGFANLDVLPKVKIISVSANQVTGTATANTNIELFYSDCNCYDQAPKTYFATVMADVNGNWQYPGLITGNVMASATSNKITGLFAKSSIDETNLIIEHATCNKKGSIKGLSSPYTSGFRWYNEQNELVSVTKDLLDVEAGKYTLKIGLGGECDVTKTYQIADHSIIVDASNLQYNNPACNGTGSITGMITTTNGSSQLRTRWIDKDGANVCQSCVDLKDVKAGFYRFMVENLDGSCQQTLGPFVLNNTDGPNISQSNQAITSTNCGEATGSITGVTATGTGTLKYSWKNEQGVEVGTTADLLNQSGGKYRLQVTDDTQCGAVYSTEIIIPELNGVTLNTTNVNVRSATCGQNNGFVKGLQAPGATQFVWTRPDGSVAGNTIDLENIGPGDYRLTYSNATCSNITDFRIDLSPPTVFPEYPAVATKTCFDFPTGTVSINTDGFAIQPGIIRWVNSQGTDVGFGKSIQFMPAGVYSLYFTDGTGCENLYKTYTIESYPELTIAKFGTITNINCGLGKGSITATVFTGGTGNYVYEWLDENGVVIGTEPSIQNLEVGNYTLRFTDGGCNLRNLPYSIIDAPSIPPTPLIENISLCTAGNTTIRVQEPFATAIYRIYDTETGTQPIDEQIGGRFTVNVDRTRSYYISLTYGTCEGERAEVKVAVGLTGNNIANTFTPNGDGTNDFWRIPDIDNYPNVTVSVFNRAGLQVYQSRGYGQPFDGTYQGKALPAGAYYYIIRLSSACNILSGNVNIIR